MTTAALAHVRSLLFAPGSDARKLERALASEADAVVADLEDSVVAAEKARARERRGRVCFALPGPAPGGWSGSTGPTRSYFADDVEALAGMQLDGDRAAEGDARVGGRPRARRPAGGGDRRDGAGRAARVRDRLVGPRVVALVLGAADLGAQLWLEPREDNQELLFARSKLVVDSAAAGIRAPFDVVHLNVEDDAGIEAEARLARSLGLRGKACIHPRQVAGRQPGLRGRARPRWAGRATCSRPTTRPRRDGRGALVVRGALVDLALVQRARMIMATTEGADT